MDGTTRIALYTLDHIHATLGVPSSCVKLPRETEFQDRLAGIFDRGDEGRWRTLLPPPTDAETKIESLIVRAPHFEQVGKLIITHLRSATKIGLPTRLPPLLLTGNYGIGKSWWLSRLGAALGLPFKKYAMNSASLGESLQGAHASWRNAQPGVVAKMLLSEQVANGVIFVDECDKAAAHAYNTDPYRPFYSFLDPSDAKAFEDEYLSFPMDASHLSWILAGNDPTLIPAPILDRLTLIAVPEPDEAQRARVALSIYAEANKSRRSFFDDNPGPAIIERLAGMSPRTMRKSLDEAMVRASANGRCSLRADDVITPATCGPKRFGFCR